MKFSLIIGTLNRKDTLSYCINSLLVQQYKDFEIIVIDQSNNDQTKKLVESYNNNLLNYHKVEFKGLSKARNEALKYVTGDYFCLIDDDAFYDKYYLSNAFNHLKSIEEKHVILSGYIYDTITKQPFAYYDYRMNGRSLSIKSIMKTCPSAALFFPISVINECGSFDELLGVGGLYGAGEETDLLLRAINKGYSVVYFNDIKLQHPYPIVMPKTDYEDQIRKMISYYRGIGALYKKHLFINKNFKLLLSFLTLCLKFTIKNILVIEFDHKKAYREARGFMSGIKNYSC